MSIEQQILGAVKDKLVELGYLTNDGSMNIYSEIFKNISKAEKYTVIFVINNDYTILVSVKLNNFYSKTLHCGLQIVTAGEPLYYHFSDDTFDIVTK